MKIKQQQAIEAYMAVRKLEYQDMPGEKAMVMFKLRKALEPQYQFQDEQERKIIESLGATIGADGFVAFKSDDDKAAYTNKLNEICNLEVDINIEQQTIDAKGMTLSVKDIEALEPVVKII